MKPPIASSASRRNAMLQPGTCSAVRSSSRTWVGSPGARAMHCAIGGSSCGHDVRATRADDVRGQERLHEKRQPVAIDARVRIRVRDDIAGRGRQADVAGGAQPLIRRVDDLHRRIAGRDLAGAIFRSVVDDNHLIVRIGERGRASEDSRRWCWPRCRRRRRPRREATSSRTSRGNGASSNAAATATAAGFGFRSRSTRPNAQSATG